MIDPSEFLISHVVIMLLLIAAIVGCLLMLSKRHHFILIPVVGALGWMLLAYLLHSLGVIGDASRMAMLRAGLAVLCVSFIVGAILYRVGHDH